MAKEQKYSAKDITVLEGLEAVRRRPGMYIGTTGTDGLHHLLTEVFENSRDEAMGGFANEIEITLLPNNYVRVVDNGRGIPIDTHKKTKVSALETIMTNLHAGGKFGGEGYKVSGGLHGVGVSVVNALSESTKVIVHRDGDVFMQEYEKGKVKDKIKKIGKSKTTGTIVTFLPDKEILNDINIEWERVVNQMRQQAYLIKNTTIRMIDARETDVKVSDDIIYLNTHLSGAPRMTFFFEGGISLLVKHQNEHHKPIHNRIFYIEKTKDDILVEVALQYVDDMTPRIIAFANNTYNPDGGTHVTGFKTALTRTINAYIKDKKIDKGRVVFAGDDVLEGLTVVISIKLAELQFEGQTKAKLGSTEAKGAVESVFGDAFAAFLEENPQDAKAIIARSILAYESRLAAKSAREGVLRKGALEGSSLPGKLADCQSKNFEESELFIVEGESAGGTAKQGRDRRTQAVLPLRGKILNVWRTRIDRAFSSEEIRAVSVALGTGVESEVDLAKLRYHKVIIATDADVDGAHIRTLLLTLFYRYFKPLIQNGHIYIAQPPLYKIKIGKESFYAYSDEERDKILSKTGKADSDKVPIQRYKGLGEMNFNELKETTMDKDKRILKQVRIEDALSADEIFDTLMGNEIAPRRLFIQTNAKYANIDL